MKRIIGATLVILAVAALAAAQTGTTSGTGFQLSTPTTQRKAPPAAKTPEEGATYQAIVTNPDLPAAEAGAKGFETTFPQSELRGPIYQNLMYRYQQANNADKTIEMGRKALQFDPDQPMALVTVASVLSERTKETDLDRDQRLAEAMQDAQRALTGMDAWLATAPPPVTDQLAQSMKPVLSSFAHAAMGMVEMTRKNPAEAEKHYRASVELNTMRPEAITWLRLALALDAQKKYAEALPAANRAVELSAATPGMVAEWAKQLQTRLNMLTGQTPSAPAPAAPPPPAGSAGGPAAPKAASSVEPGKGTKILVATGTVSRITNMGFALTREVANKKEEIAFSFDITDGILMAGKNTITLIPPKGEKMTVTLGDTVTVEYGAGESGNIVKSVKVVKGK